jgi:rsbT antagonist protein RsbS
MLESDVPQSAFPGERERERVRVPVIRLWSRLVVVLQGDISDEVAARLMDDVLEEIRGSGAAGLVLDVSGILVVDSHLVHVLSNLAQAALIMGTPAVVCGMSPEVAMTLQMMGAEPKFMQTALTLEDALRRLGVRVQVEKDVWDREDDEDEAELSGEDLADDDGGLPIRPNAGQVDRYPHRVFDSRKVRSRRSR